MVLSCLPGASQAVQLVLSCLPGASSGCPISPFLHPWCLPGASQAVQLVLSYFPGASQALQLVLSCLPGASQAVQPVLSCLPGASNWSFPASLAPPRQSRWSCLPGAFRMGLWSLPAVPMVFQRLLAVSRVSKIKAGLGRLLGSVGFALADYWNHPV